MPPLNFSGGPPPTCPNGHPLITSTCHRCGGPLCAPGWQVCNHAFFIPLVITPLHIDTEDLPPVRMECGPGQGCKKTSA